MVPLHWIALGCALPVLAACPLACGAASGLDLDSTLPTLDAGISLDAPTNPLDASASCGFQVGGSTSASIVGTVVSATPDGTEGPFIGLRCNGAANGTTYQLFADFSSGIELSTNLGTATSTQTAFQGCAYDARLNGQPFDDGGAYGVGDFLQITFDHCESTGSASPIVLENGYLTAVLTPRD
jgi:hypothetical protein